MSLSKKYRVRCDGSTLLMDRVMALCTDNARYGEDLKATHDQRIALQLECTYIGPDEWDARKARTAAKAKGWTRRTEQRPIYAGTTETTKVPYDLCPSCTKMAEQPGLPEPVATAHP